MRLNKIVLKNFRGAVDLSLDIHEKLNVFYGVNGAGKSTILDATAACLARFATKVFRFKKSAPLVNLKDIRNGQQKLEIQTSFSFGELDHVIELRRHCKEKRYSSEFNMGLNVLIMQQQAKCEEGKINEFPLLAYYPVNRAVVDIPLRIKTKHTFEIPDALDGALSSAANFRAFFEWFREREDIENENVRIHSPISGDINQYLDSQLQAVRTAIYNFMPGFSDLSVRRSPLRMEVKKQGQKLHVEQLSDGEKCLLAMVGDIARRLAIANPNNPRPLECDGVVLIDEIDLHLHPTWQHRVIPKLTETFPGCQFLISTHSPHVITHVRPEQLFFLQMDDGELRAEHPRESYGKNAERIYEDLMEMPTTRPEATEKEINEIYSLISRSKFNEAKNRIESLRESIGNDSELVRARSLIQRKELVEN